MPNWVKNNVSVFGNKNEVNSFTEKHFTGEEKKFDFNTIKPMPSTIFTGNLGQEEREKYGENNWYDWSITNWGTKWNASDTCIFSMSEFSDDTAQLRFSYNTAWSCPEGIYQEMAKLYPKLDFDIEFADEDIGSNCGTVMIDDGQAMVQYNEDEEFAREVWGYDED